MLLAEFKTLLMLDDPALLATKACFSLEVEYTWAIHLVRVQDTLCNMQMRIAHRSTIRNYANRLTGRYAETVCEECLALFELGESQCF